MKKILTVGSVTADLLVHTVDALPKPGVLQGVQGVKMFPGGCAVNAALDLAKLGGNVSLSCLVGDDAFGKMLSEHFKSSGLDTRGVITSSEVSTTVSVVLNNSAGERSFLYYPGSSAAFGREHIGEELIGEADIVFVAGAMLLPSFEGVSLESFLRDMQKLGKFTVMDTAWDKDGVWLPKIKEALKYTDLFMPSREEAEMLSGRKKPDEIADFFFELGCKSVIIKLGSEGALVCKNKCDRFLQPCSECREVVDTTGAGDSFCAGFLLGLSKGWSYERSAELASCVASCCIEQRGASAGILTFDETVERLGW